MADPAIVFDLGNVLLAFDYHRAVSRLAAQSALSEQELHALINQSPLLLDYERGALTTKEFFEQVKKSSAFRGNFGEFKNIFGDIFTEIPEMVALNDQLRAKGFDTYIFSNTNDLAVEFIRGRFPFFANFHKHVLSYEEASMKPDARIYEAVEKATGRTGQQIVYIDDRHENIVAGAARGWHAIQHNHHAETTAALRKLGVI